jgi:hypothetical protein
MNTTLIALALTFATTTVSAAGFAPWNDRAVDLDQSFDAPADVRIAPFYGDGLPNVNGETPDRNQRAIAVTPFYRIYV